MHLPLTSAALPSVQWIDETDSTNALMRSLLSADETDSVRGQLPHGALIATANQTAGRGRQGRGWETPENTALAASLVVRAEAHGGEARDGLRLSWLPLLAGSALVAALQPLFQAGRLRDVAGGGHGDAQHDGGEHGGALRVGVKWPNDVHVRGEADAMLGKPGAKLCGILCEVVPDGAVIVGFGVNLLQEEWQLPTERAGSVLACGGDVGGAVTLADPKGVELLDRVLATATTELLQLVDLAAENPAAARRRVLRDSLTLGAEVRVHLPGGEVVDGRAVGLDDDGALIVDRPTSGQLIVNAADVEHLR